MSQNNFLVRQRFTAMINRYEIWAVDAEWNQTTLMGFAEQKRMKLREEIVFFTDDTKKHVLFRFKARNIVDIKSIVDVFDGPGQVIGTFRKDWAASLLSSTWYLEQPGLPTLKGTESSMVYAIIRRFTDFGFIPYSFEYKTADGRLALDITRKFGLRDTYRCTVQAPEYDTRVLQAVAVAMDTLQNR